MAEQRRVLGKGLGALIATEDNVATLTTGNPESSESGAVSGVLEIDINKLEPNKDQPRKRFDEDSLEELANSIKQFGVIQPIIATKTGDASGYYKIVAGERRWRASRIAQLKTVPVIIKELGEMEILQIALIENIQRQDLNPIEEALCYQKLCDVFFFRQEDIAVKVSKSRASISGMLSLLKLDPRVKNLIAEGKLTASQGRKLLEIKSGDIQFEVGEKAIDEQMNISQIGAHIDFLSKKENAEDEAKAKKSTDGSNSTLYKSIEKDLMNTLGTKVMIKDKKNKGKIEIEYYSKDELDRLIGLFKKAN